MTSRTCHSVHAVGAVHASGDEAISNMPSAWLRTTRSRLSLASNVVASQVPMRCLLWQIDTVQIKRCQINAIGPWPWLCAADARETRQGCQDVAASKIVESSTKEV